MTNVEYDNEEEFNEIVDKFEPVPAIPLSETDSESLRTSAIVSIAISLKRIADSMLECDDDFDIPDPEKN